MREGWYLMNTVELERAVAAWRRGDRDKEYGTRLSIDAAIERRNAGNVPDDEDRSLRLVLFVDAEPLDRKRLRWEPDYHEAPGWRREGSRLVNVVPLRVPGAPVGDGRPWWEMTGVDALEEEWRQTGSVAGIDVPAEYRSFVFKTVIALREAGREITPDSIGDSISRWLSIEDAETIKASLKKKEPGS